MTEALRGSSNENTKATEKIEQLLVEKEELIEKIETLPWWGEKVTVISSDMREWNPPKEDYADILVSELLGR